jgi:hypothetical protein
MVAVPEVPPKHNTSVNEAVDVSKGGSVMVTESVAVQPSASVMVTVYDPAVNAVPVAVFPPDGDHAYV